MNQINEHTFTSSKNLRHASLDQDGMTMEFMNGGRYAYPGVTEAEFKRLCDADLDPDQSAGIYFHKHFKGRPFQKLERLDEGEAA
jgi:hypothetical protein